MAQEQRLNLEQTQEILDTLDIEVDCDNMNIGLDDDQTYDLDAILNEIENMEDLTIVDVVFGNLQSELLDKSEYLKNIQHQNANRKSALNTSKYFTSELEELQRDEQNMGNDLKDMIETRRMELDELHNQQVNNLFQFESDVQKRTDNYMHGPKDYEYETLIDKLEQMKNEVEGVFNELSQYKQDLLVSEGKLGHDKNTAVAVFGPSIEVFEGSIKDIKTLNEKLTTSVDKLSNRLKNLQFDSTQRPFK